MFPLKPASSSSSSNSSSTNSISPSNPSQATSPFAGRGGIGGSGFLGANEDLGANEFMESVLELGLEGEDEERRDEREGWEMSYLGAHGEPLDGGEREVLIRDMSPISPATMRRFDRNGLGFTKKEEGNDGEKGEEKVRFRVKDLSRLWLYVNGKSPKVDETDVGIARMSTI